MTSEVVLFFTCTNHIHVPAYTKSLYVDTDTQKTREELSFAAYMTYIKTYRKLSSFFMLEFSHL